MEVSEKPENSGDGSYEGNEEKVQDPKEVDMIE